jgi:hypothetical protein
MVYGRFRALSLSVLSERKRKSAWVGLILLSHAMASITHSWSWALLEKLPIVQLLKNFLTFYGTWMFIIVFTRALHWSLSLARSIRSIPSHPISLRSVFYCSPAYFFCPYFNAIILSDWTFKIIGDLKTASVQCLQGAAAPRLKSPGGDAPYSRTELQLHLHIRIHGSMLYEASL